MIKKKLRKEKYGNLDKIDLAIDFIKAQKSFSYTVTCI